MKLNKQQTICSCWIQIQYLLTSPCKYSRLRTFHLTPVLIVISVWLHLTFLVNTKETLNVLITFVSPIDIFYSTQIADQTFPWSFLWLTYNILTFLLHTTDCLICPPPACPSSLMELFLIAQPSEQLCNSCHQKQTEILPLRVSFFFFICSDFSLWCGWYLRKTLKIPDLV